MNDEQKTNVTGEEPEPPENETLTEGYMGFYTEDAARQERWKATWPDTRFVRVGKNQTDRYIASGYRVLEADQAKVGYEGQVLMGCPIQLYNARQKAREAEWAKERARVKTVGGKLTEDLSPEATDLLRNADGSGFTPLDS